MQQNVTGEALKAVIAQVPIEQFSIKSWSNISIYVQEYTVFRFKGTHSTKAFWRIVPLGRAPVRDQLGLQLDSHHLSSILNFIRGMNTLSKRLSGAGYACQERLAAWPRTRLIAQKQLSPTVLLPLRARRDAVIVAASEVRRF